MKILPNKTNERMSVYLSAFLELKNKGVVSIKSAEFEKETGILSTTIRRDLSYLGTFGKQRVGYNVDLAIITIGKYLESSKITIGNVHVVYRINVSNGEESIHAIFNNDIAAAITVDELNHSDMIEYEYMYKKHEINKIPFRGGNNNATND